MRKLAVAAEVSFGRFGASDARANGPLVCEQERPTQRVRLTQNALDIRTCVSRKCLIPKRL